MTMFAPMHDPRPAQTDPLGDRQIPRIRIVAFCETPEMTDVVSAAAADRRMMRAQVETASGGTRAAITRFRQSPSPDLILLERQVPGDLLFDELEKLAEVCDSTTKVMVIGASNDIRLYRELLSRGISDYLVGPVDAPTLLGAIIRIYTDGDARKLGRTYAFVGAKGGVGSSTVAHNVASTIARSRQLDVILADLDLPFGTAGLDFNLDGAQGMAEVLESTGRLDELLLERLLGRCGDRLSMLAAPVTLDRSYDLREEALDELVDVAKASASNVVLDMPHLWTAWARRMLIAADEVVVTAAPDLAGLRNAKGLVEALRRARPHDGATLVVLNQVGMAKRTEIKPAEFAKALGLGLTTCIPFDPRLFGKASNNGQMISELSSASAAPFATIADALLVRSGQRKKTTPKRGLFSGLSMRGRAE